MKKPRQKPFAFAGTLVPTCAILILLVMLWPKGIAAQVPPPPDTPTPSPTPTNTSENTPTHTPTPTFTSTPTFTPTPSLTPTATSTPTPTASRTAIVLPTSTSKAKEPKPNPNTDCQSKVEGTVFDAAGQAASGATVSISGEGWSSSMMTDDNGNYGFGGLCAGTITLRATYLDGQLSGAATGTLDGHNSIRLDLSGAPATKPVATTTTSMLPTATIAEQATPEPSMPATGYSGWILLGGVLLAAMVLVLAGVRRALGAMET